MFHDPAFYKVIRLKSGIYLIWVIYVLAEKILVICDVYLFLPM